ncbi:seminase [Drosophila grimshawi]|uniref:trypsin n=1 Tax=Drosophila grimshawi TaxID=7222 RepID=B4IX47_DROGR|nr:seminase [Drosophila grimshawi]EDV96353.1 GH15252 [Drosophila grimshawi]
MQTESSLLVLLMLLLLLQLRTANGKAGNNEAGNARILGGTPVDISAVPYLVNLRIGGNFICGGSLITPTHVVTAAHCVKGVSASRLQVVGGATRLTDATAGVRRNVAKVYTPKAYNIRTLHSDVAVLKLQSPLVGANIETIALCNSSWEAGNLIRVSGWGKTAEKSNRVSQQVRSVEVALITRKSCMDQYKLRGTIGTTMFCAAGPGVKDACEGDSGGPAVYQNQLCGIVSWGLGCGRRNYPGVYTSVKTVRSFIDKALAL